MKSLYPFLSGFRACASLNNKKTIASKLPLIALFCFSSFSVSAQSTTFSYTGALQTYTVPSGVYSLGINAQGASGGISNSYGVIDSGGKGGLVQCILAVTPGQVLNIYVGGAGVNASGTGSSHAGGYNGGGTGYIGIGAGGGGASDIRAGGTALSNRVVVAAGGGGGGFATGFSGGDNGGAGGGLSGGYGGGDPGIMGSYTINGLGGTQTAGGSGGGYTGVLYGGNGSLGTGGNAYAFTTYGAGGGGGGYYGGGGAFASGGGGGSSYTDPVTASSVFHTSGYNSLGDGVVIICTTPPAAGAVTGPTGVCVGSSITLSDPTATIGGSWTSSITAHATIGSSSGIVNGVATGSSIITYQVTNSCATAYTTQSVNVTSVAGITGDVVAYVGYTTNLYDAGVSGIWSSSNTAVATVGSGTGIVTGVSTGATTISYTIGGSCSATATLNVLSAVTGGPIITTFAGSGTGTGYWGTYGGDGGPASAASFSSPTDVRIDASGNYYICDGLNYRIRKITPSGVISTIAGNGTAGFSGDGGPSTAAAINGATGLAIDGSGNIYFSDYYNYRVRKINTSGIITTIAGTGVNGLSGDRGPATAAKLAIPTGLNFDAAGNLYIVNSSVVRKINTSGIITTFAGAGSVGFGGDGGPTTAALMNNVHCVVADATGNIYLSDWANNRIRKVNASGIINTIAGSSTGGYSGDGGPATAAMIAGPYGLAFDGGGNLLFSDQGAIVRLINTSGIISTIAGGNPAGFGGDGGPATAGRLNYTDGITISSTGDLYIADQLNNRIRKVAFLNNHAPSFTAGHTQSLAVCENTTANSLNTQLAVLDSDAGQTENWSILYGPLNGSAVITSAMTSTGGLLTPSGLSYTPASGYAGNDTLIIRVTDGLAWDTTRIYITVTPAPAPITGIATVCVGSSTTLSDVVTGGLWSSGSLSVATVGSSTGTVNGVASGIATITYSTGTGCNVTIVVTVNTITASSIGGPSSVCLGSAVTMTDVAPGAWSSSNPSIATVGSLTGIVSGISAGNATITFNTGCGSVVTAPVTVNPVPAAIGGPAAVCAGSSITATDATSGGSWSSGNTSVASIGSGSGIITGGTAATDTIIYTLSTGCSSSELVTVNPLPTPVTATVSVCPGSTTTFYHTGGGTWTSGATSVATIGSTTGFMIGVASGIAPITYTLPTGCITSFTVTVAPGPAPISGSGSLVVGTTTTLTDLPGGTWTSNSAITATVGSSSGVVTGVAVGTTTITCVIGSCHVTMPVTVTPYPGGGPIISTFAGSGYGYGYWGSYGGDGGAATAASLYYPQDVKMDAAGNLLFCDAYNNRIRMVSPSGIITTIAGVPLSGYTGDGGPATAAELYRPNGLALDPAGNIYFSDNGNRVIRKINTSGIITTVAGTGVIGSLSNDGDGGPATAAPLLPPVGVYADGAGNIYFPTGSNIRKVNAAGIITSIAGNSAFGFTGDGGPATAATLNYPVYPIFDGAGNLYFSDQANSRVRKISTTGIITTVAGNGTITPSGDGGPATAAGLNESEGIAFDASGNYYFGDINSNNIRKVNTSGIITTYAGNGTAGFTGDGGPATAAEISSPWGITVSAAGDLYIADAYNNRIRKVTYQNNHVPVFTGGHTQSFALCQNSSAYSLNTLLAVVDSDAGQTETWSLVSGPGHGTAVVAYSAFSTGSAITPAGLNYSPTTGYSGFDTLVVRVTDGAASDTAKFYITVNALPSAISGSAVVCGGSSTTLTDAGSGTWTSATTSVATIGSLTGIVNGIAPGTSLITYTLGTGCSTSITVTVSPLMAAITGTATVCTGATTTMADVSGGTWSSGSASVATVGSSSGIVSGITAGTATITCSSGTGCIATRVVTVYASPAPIVGPTSICVGSNATLTDSTPGGAWTLPVPGILTYSILSGFDYTGVSVGTAGVTYTLAGTGCYASVTVTVTSAPGPISGSSDVCVGSSIALTDGTPGGLWTSSTTGIATVGTLSGLVSGIAPGTSTITYSLGTGCTTSIVVTVNPLPSAISGPPSLCDGATVTLTDAGGGAWSTSGTVFTVGSSSGVVTTVAAGVAAITYTLSTGCYTTRSETVNPLPGAISGASSVCASFATTLTDATAGGTWSSTVGILAIGSTGIVAGLFAGTATISYTLSTGCYATLPFTVNPIPGAITGTSTVCVGATTTLSETGGGLWSTGTSSIATIGSTSGILSGLSSGTTTAVYTLPTGCSSSRTITVNALPASISGTATLCVGSTTTFSDAGSGAWTSTGTSVATIGSSTGIVSGVSAGTALIVYTLLTGCTASKTVTVDALPSSISGSAVVCVGSTTTLTDAGGGTWSSSTTGVATIGSATGIVSGVSSGISTITYTLGTGCQTTEIVTVNALPSAITGTSALYLGTTITLSDGTSGGTWSSSNTSVATVGSSTGDVTGIAGGSATITYTLGTGCYSTTSVSVTGTPAPISGASTVCEGATITLTDASEGGTWSSSDATIATVGSSTGIVSGVAGGTVTISFTVSGVSAAVSVTVTPIPAVIAGPSTVCSGSTITLTDAASGGTWSSGSASIATAGSASGVITGVATGSVTITYSTGCGTDATFPVTVNPTPDAGAISGPSVVYTGSTISLTESVTGGTWTSDNTSVATIGSSTGVVTGIATGTANISYGVTGCGITSYATYAITDSPVNRISGNINFSGAGIDSTGTLKVWLITYDTGSTILSAVDSITMAVNGTSIYYQFLGEPVDSYRIKAAYYPATFSSTGYVPTYHSSAFYWHDADVLWHTTGSDDGTDITMGYGSVTSGPGFIAGYVTIGANKGTSGAAPATSVLMFVKNASGTILQQTYTDTGGAYSFSNLAIGQVYTVYPEELNYNSTAYTSIDLGSSDSATNINFVKHTISLTITPVQVGIKPVVSPGTSMIIFPNPTDAILNLQWKETTTEKAEVAIYDLVGRQVYNNTITLTEGNGASQIDMSGFTSGSYIITIKSASITYTNKIQLLQQH